MKRILFVDDDIHIRKALGRMLRNRRHEWELRFASNSAEALELLEQDPMDVLVSDVRMPGSSGVELLACVRERYPHVVRIILSGQADEAHALAAVEHAHQYLAKPCDATVLRATIERAFVLREYISSPSIARHVARASRLPPVSAAYLDLKRELQRDRGSPQRVAAIVSRDPAMSTRILEAVNSACFGIRCDVTNPRDAVGVLGVGVVRALVISASVFAQITDPHVATWAERVWRHSVTTGAVSAAIARAEGADADLVELSFNAGLLHDVGKLVLARCLGDDYVRWVGEDGESIACRWREEEEAYEISHSAAGGYLLSTWGLPDPLVEIVTFHHQPSHFSGGDVIPLAAVHVGNVLVHKLGGTDANSEMDAAYLKRQGLLHRTEEWEAVGRAVLAGEAMRIV